jgi:hypothetical protein
VHATRLRSAARLILLDAALPRDDDSSATTRLLLTLAVILDGLAAIREAQRLAHQAEAARETARRLRSWKPPFGQAAAAAPATSAVRTSNRWWPYRGRPGDTAAPPTWAVLGQGRRLRRGRRGKLREPQPLLWRRRAATEDRPVETAACGQCRR